MFLVCVVFLAFIAGAVITVAEISPSGYIRDAYKAGTALLEKSREQSDPFTTDLWMPANTSDQGVTVNDLALAFSGYTLYTSGHSTAAFLIAMDGRIVHQWECRFSTIWDETAAAKNPVPDRQIYFDEAHVFPNGDLLTIFIGVGDTPYGYGMVKLDKNSRVLWKNLDYFHHDFDTAPDGRIYGLTHDYRFNPPEGVDHLSQPVLDDYLVVLSPDGKEQKKISLLDAVNRSEEYRRLLWYIPYYTLEDPLHANAVDFIDDASAASLGKKLPKAAEGQVLLSFRELAGGSIALLDVKKEEIVWVSRGPWLSQHDPDILPNGNILVFDNRGHFGPGGQSRIVEFDPANGAVVWQYTGDEDHVLESWIRSTQQLLPNGNILITESNKGRLLEVTPGGTIAWEYINPVRGGKDDQLIAVLSAARRLGQFDFSPDFYAEISETP